VVSLFLRAVLLYTSFYGGADIKKLIFVGLTTPTLHLTFNLVLSVPALPLALEYFAIQQL